MQHRISPATLACAMGLLCAATFAEAQPADRRTFLTFSAPVEVPGRVLPAGRYEFRLADDGETQDVVQILSGRKVVGTYLTMPTDSLEFPKSSYVTFEKPVPGAPRAVRAWFYPGDTVGQEFVYPKQRAAAIAKVAQQPVKTTDDAMEAHMNAQEPAAQQAAVAALKDAPVQVTAPRGDDVEIIETTVIEMPKTASTLPITLAAGASLMLAGLGLGLRRRLSIER